jgi:hypothetical protein
LGFWEKPFHCRFSFGGAISTLARQEEDSSRVLIGVHLVFDFILEGVGKHIILHRVFAGDFLGRGRASDPQVPGGFCASVKGGIPMG